MSDGIRIDEPSQAQEVFRPLQAIVGLGGIQALTMLAGLARSKVLALLLGPAVLGIVGVIDQIVGLVTHAGSMSTPFAAMKFLSRRVTEEAHEFRSLFSGLFLLMLATSGLATVAVCLVAAARPELISTDLGGYGTPLLLALVSVPALTTVAFLRNVLAVVSRHRDAALASFLSAVALVAASWAGVELAGIVGLYVGNLLVHTSLAAGIYFYLRRHEPVALTAGWRAVGDALRQEEDLRWYLTVFHLTTLVTPLAYLVARVSVLNYHGAVAAGLYYAAYGVAVAVRVIFTQGNTLYLTPIVNRPTPVTERIAAAGDYIRVLSVLVLVAGLALILFPDLWIWLLYSTEFTEASTFLAPFVVGEMLLLFAGVYLQLLIGLDDLSGHIALSVAGHGAILVLALLLVPPFGPVGVAYGLVAGSVGILLGSLARLYWKRGRAKLFGPLLPMGLAIGVLVLGALATGEPASSPAAVWRVAGWIVAAGIGLLLLSPSERRWIVSPGRWAELTPPPDSGSEGDPGIPSEDGEER